MGPKEGCLPPVCRCVPVTWVTSGRQGGWAVRCCEVKPPTPPAAHTAPTHAAGSARKWVRGGGARLRLIDAGALTPPPLPTHGPPRGQREGNLNAG